MAVWYLCAQLLDLSYNRVVEVSSVEMLATCPQLHSLCLGHNPLWTLDHYRRLVCGSIPHLQVLDQKTVSAQERQPMVRTKRGSAQGFLEA